MFTDQQSSVLIQKIYNKILIVDLKSELFNYIEDDNFEVICSRLNEIIFREGLTQYTETINQLSNLSKELKEISNKETRIAIKDIKCVELNWSNFKNLYEKYGKSLEFSALLYKDSFENPAWFKQIFFNKIALNDLFTLIEKNPNDANLASKFTVAFASLWDDMIQRNSLKDGISDLSEKGKSIIFTILKNTFIKSAASLKIMWEIFPNKSQELLNLVTPDFIQDIDEIEIFTNPAHVKNLGHKLLLCNNKFLPFIRNEEEQKRINNLFPSNSSELNNYKEFLLKTRTKLRNQKKINELIENGLLDESEVFSIYTENEHDLLIQYATTLLSIKNLFPFITSLLKSELNFNNYKKTFITFSNTIKTNVEVFNSYIELLKNPLFLQVLNNNVSETHDILKSLPFESLIKLAQAIDCPTLGPLIIAGNLSLYKILLLKDKVGNDMYSNAVWDKEKLTETLKTTLNPLIKPLIDQQILSIDLVHLLSFEKTLEIATLFQKPEVNKLIACGLITLNNVKDSDNLVQNIKCLLGANDIIAQLITSLVFTRREISELLRLTEPASEVEFAQTLKILQANTKFFRLKIITIPEFVILINSSQAESFFQDMNNASVDVHDFLTNCTNFEKNSSVIIQDHSSRKTYLEALSYPDIRYALKTSREVITPANIVNAFTISINKTALLAALSNPVYKKQIFKEASITDVVQMGNILLEPQILFYLKQGYLTTEEIVDNRQLDRETLSTLAKCNFLSQLKKNVNDPNLRAYGRFGRNLPDGIEKLKTILSTCDRLLTTQDSNRTKIFSPDLQVKINKIFDDAHKILERKQNPYRGFGTRENDTKTIYKNEYQKFKQFTNISYWGNKFKISNDCLNTSVNNENDNDLNNAIEASDEIAQLMYEHKEYATAKKHLEYILTLERKKQVFDTVNIENIKFRLIAVNDAINGTTTELTTLPLQGASSSFILKL